MRIFFEYVGMLDVLNANIVRCLPRFTDFLRDEVEQLNNE